MKTIIHDVYIGQTIKKTYLPLRLTTDRGIIESRYYHSPDSEKGIVFVGGLGGGFDSPANNVYPRLSRQLQMHRISSFHLQFRNPISMQESVFDVLSGLTFLGNIGISQLAIVGYAFGGAVAIKSAAIAQHIETVVTLASQSYGTEEVQSLSDTTSLLLMHGADDEVLSPSCSLQIHKKAHNPKNLIIFEKTGHELSEVAEKVQELLHEWLIVNLTNSAPDIFKRSHTHKPQ